LIFDVGQGPAHASSSCGRDEELVDELLLQAAAPSTTTEATKKTRLNARHATAGGVRAVFLFAFLGALAACTGDGPLDTVSDTTLDSSVWRADGQKVAAALPHAVGDFKASKDPAPFWTSYGSGPVFGADATYAQGSREVVVHVESGNIRQRVTSAEQGHANPGESFTTSQVSVHGKRATLHWNGIGKTGDVVFVVDRRFLVQMRLMPSKSADEIVSLAETFDVAQLPALALEGTNRP
jgi:hypothetical protein